MVAGFAAAQCGKALPFRDAVLFSEAAPLPYEYRGAASGNLQRSSRKGEAFLHCTAAKPMLSLPWTYSIKIPSVFLRLK
jgi:hypothetical protein